MSTKRSTKKSKIPRRAEILNVLRKHDKPLSDRALYQAFGIRKGPDRDAFVGRLKRMQRDGLLLADRRNRFILPDKMDVIRGRVIGHAKGFGFLTPETGGNDLYIPASEMRKVLHGDRILARVVKIDRRGRKEVSIIEILERANVNVVGRFVVEQGLAFVIPDDTRIGQDVFIPPDLYNGAEEGQIVVAEIKRQPSLRSQPIGQVIEVLGEHLAPGMEIEVAIRKFGLPNNWNDSVSSEASRLPADISLDEIGRRWDIRDLPLVTIDGEDARDFDDAVYCEKSERGWRLVVAIADVSHYVKQEDPLDQEALRRGNSVYFPSYVIPMLPERLSNDLCSLKPMVDRLCFACEIFIDSQGRVKNFQFKLAVMRSAGRLTYTETAQALLNKDESVRARLADVLPNLENLHALSRLLRDRRQIKGTVDFDLPESRIVFNDERKILRIEAVARNEAHELIEECMLVANVCAAKAIYANQSLAIFRIHDVPDQAKVEDVRRFIGEFGLTLGGGSEPDAKHYWQVVEQSRDKSYARIVQTALLRSMKQAVYSSESKGHFALGFEHYTHFTSPIRRYPDLVVHRELKKAIRSVQSEHDEIDKYHVADIADHCSMTERRADDATREVIQWLKAEFMLDHVGDEFAGTITTVTDFGVFVELDEFLIEGLIHVTALGRDYFQFDPISRRLRGERSGHRYQIGDSIQVRVVRVDLDEAKIDLEPVGKVLPRKKRPTRARKK
ncbi:MAG: ribonuclease R [Arenicellales bacterium]|nr:ribonuclease R [Arenicellales bacterium]